MFQSNKEYLEFLKQSGVHSFLQETPNNLFEDQQKQTHPVEDQEIKSISIFLFKLAYIPFFKKMLIIY